MYVYCVCEGVAVLEKEEEGAESWEERGRKLSQAGTDKNTHLAHLSSSLSTYIRTVLCPHGDVLKITRVSLGQLRIEAHGEHALAASSEGGRREDKARDGREGGKEQGGGALHGFECAVFVYVGVMRVIYKWVLNKGLQRCV